MRCLGFGEFEGKCQNEAGTSASPFWCPRCDGLRRDHISKQLDEINSKIERKLRNGKVQKEAGSN